ncbi:ABC transporter permease [Streptomyces sp. CHD11]|uniref:ABC transporter permease n=1 Tax=Streptomyces sp. CHD11 TaxID=2741325 RepID=UPI001BFCA0EF|nr:ABC transporter permease [Streptomyces sp. CHD11]MBT3154510.1 ABC transporter permease [Streptomyces sp. CHD11]
MTTTTERPAPATVTTGRRASWAAVFVLAGFETRRLLLRVPVLVAFGVYAAWIGWRALDAYDGFPALQDVDRATQNGPQLVGLAVLLSVHQAVLRSRRHDTDRHLSVLMVQPWRRTVAHLLSVVPVALLVALCVGAQFTREALKPGAVGHGSPGELLVGPLSVLLFGGFGVLLGRLLPVPLAAPLLIVFLLFFFALAAEPTGEGWTRWLVPSVGENSVATLPSDLIGRPAGWHALYLAGLALSVALLAVLVSGARLRTVQACVACAVALTTVGAVGQSRGVPEEVTAAREQATVAPEKTQKCVERDGTTYCAFPEWGPRTGDWAGIVDDVRSRAGGGGAGDRPLTVRQRIEARYGLDGDAALAPSARPDEVTVGTSWGGSRVPEFAVTVAGVLVTGGEEALGEMCDGRIVTVMWLGLAGRPDPVADLRRVRLDDSASGSAIVISQTEPLSMTTAHTELVVDLLGQPRDEVAAKVKDGWAELTAPGVTTERVAGVLGVDAPEGEDECE